jgi:hypothetical protein
MEHGFIWIEAKRQNIGEEALRDGLILTLLWKGAASAAP